MTVPSLPVPASGIPAAITGIGGYRPRRVVTNEEICRTLDSSPEWIERRSGIVTRRFAQPDETLVDMGAAAGAKALGDAGLAPYDVDLVLLATMSRTPDSPPDLPGAVAERLGVRAPAIGVNAACSGFTVALNLAAQAVGAGSAKACLVVAVERMSDIVEPTDRGTAFIFADGAGAATVQPAAVPGIGPAVQGSDTSLNEAIAMRPDADGRMWLRMAGSTVFRWAMTELPAVVGAVLEASRLTAHDIRAFIPHQANLRITRSVTDSVGLPASVAVADDVIEHGNTSAASIPLALERMRDSGEAARGDLALLLGFGAGLSYAGLIVSVP